MTKDEAIKAVVELLTEYGCNVDDNEATKLVEIGMQVKAKIQPMSELFEEEERRIEWTAEQRAVADAALVREREKLK